MCLLPLEIFDISNQLMYKCVGQFHLPAFTLIRQPATENKYHYFLELTKACEMRRSHIMFKKGNSRGWDPFLIAWSVGDFLKTLGIYFVPKMRSLVYVDQGIPKVETVYKQAFSLHRHPRWKKDYYGHLVTYARCFDYQEQASVVWLCFKERTHEKGHGHKLDQQFSENQRIDFDVKIQQCILVQEQQCNPPFKLWIKSHVTLFSMDENSYLTMHAWDWKG